MRKRIVFFILRTSFYRTLGPLIEFALSHGEIDPVILLGPSFASKPIKGSQSPSLENVPTRLRGAEVCVCSTYQEIQEELRKTDAAVSIVGPRYIRDFLRDFVPDFPSRQGDGDFSCPWFTVYDTADTCMPEIGAIASERIYWPESEPLEDAIRLHPPGDADRLRSISEFVGYVRSDVLSLLDSGDLRQRFGLDPDRPVVLWVPDNFVLKNDRAMVTPWFHYIWLGQKSRLGRAWAALRYLRNPAAALRALTLNASDSSVCLALRSFCDRNHAQLVAVPRRHKDSYGPSRFTPLEEALSDCLLPEEEGYPQSFMLGVAIADLLVCGYRSAGILDAAGGGVPYVTVAVPSEAFSPRIQEYHTWFDSFFRQPGLHHTLPAERFVTDFPRMGLQDFKVDPEALSTFRGKHMGPCDGQASLRILNSILSWLSEKRQAAC